MDVPAQVPLDNPQQVSQWLQSVLPPGYTYTVRGRFVVVGNGSATGVLIRPTAPGSARLQWAFPSMAVQILLTLSIVLTGILPGLILFGIVWAVVSGGVGRMKGEIARVLAQGAGAQAMPPGAVPAAASGGGGGGGGGRVVGMVFLLIAMCSGAFAGYEYYEYDRLRSSSFRSYGTYGRYGSYGSGYDYSYWRRREHKERFQVAGAASALFFLIGFVLVAVGGKRAPTLAQPGGYSMQQGGYPMQQQGGYPMQQQGGYPMQQQGGYPMQQQGGYPQGYPSNPGMAPQQPMQQGYPQQGGMVSQQGYAPQGHPSNPGMAPQQPVQQGYPSNPGAPPQQGYPQNPGGWPGPQGGGPQQ